MMNVCRCFIFLSNGKYLTLVVLYSNWMNQFTFVPFSISGCDDGSAWLINLNCGCAFNTLIICNNANYHIFRWQREKSILERKKLENKKKKLCRISENTV